MQIKFIICVRKYFGRDKVRVRSLNLKSMAPTQVNFEHIKIRNNIMKNNAYAGQISIRNCPSMMLMTLNLPFSRETEAWISR